MYQLWGSLGRDINQATNNEQSAVVLPEGLPLTGDSILGAQKAGSSISDRDGDLSHRSSHQEASQGGERHVEVSSHELSPNPASWRTTSIGQAGTISSTSLNHLDMPAEDPEHISQVCGNAGPAEPVVNNMVRELSMPMGGTKVL